MRPASAIPQIHKLALLTLFLAIVSASKGPALAEDGSHNVHSVFVAPPHAGGKPDALEQRVMAKLRQSGTVRVVADEKQADAVLHLEGVFWPAGSMTLNPRSQSGSFTTYQGYVSAELAAPTRQVLWSYLATPIRFKMTGIVNNLADQISERLIALIKSGIAVESASSSTNKPAGRALRAAGATFPEPLYLKWFQSFAAQPGGVKISYDAIGSTRGMEELTTGAIEIAASDIPPPADSSTPSRESDLLSLPSVVGGVVPIYNIAGSHGEMDLTGEVLAEVYSGKITRWNDPRIQSLNKNIRLPDAPIAVLHRSDGSGTTFVWTSYLALSSPDWKNKAGATVDWPTGTGMAGNAGVANAVAATPNSIGYVEMTYAIQHHLPYAGVRNPAGRTVKAGLDSIAAAAQSFRKGSDTSGSASDEPGMLLNSSDRDAYPISTFTWLVVSRSQPDADERASIKRFLQWMLSDGQRQCSSLGYAPLPRDLVTEEQNIVDRMK